MIREELTQLGSGAHALAIQILGNPDDARDVVQDSFAVVLGRPNAYDASKGPLRPWFLRLVRNRCIDFIRSQRPSAPVDEQPAGSDTDPQVAAENSQRDAALKSALQSLEPEQREIIVLRDYMDLSYAEIAGVLDVPAGTVMSRLHRARLALGKAYRDRYDEPN
jgi:RNA polymerase sigma-70 factor (ECF subfamily)